MSVVLKLDRPTLAKMIEEDPDLKFELSTAVVSEVVRKLFDKDISKLLLAAQPQLFAEALKALQDDADMTERVRRALTQQLAARPTWSGLPAMSPELKRIFDDAVVQSKIKLETMVQTILNQHVTDKAQAMVDELLADRDIDTRIAKRVDRLVDEQLEARVKAHQEALMAKLKGVLG